MFSRLPWPDPLVGLWDEEIVLLITTPVLRPVTIYEDMMRRHPDRDWPSMRRISQWKAHFGKKQEVNFRQEHPIGEQGQLDFTDINYLNVTVAGEPFPHKLFHFGLVFSDWEHAEVVLGGESFTALSTGLQNALWKLGGAPGDCRSDSLSAAYTNLTPETREDLTKRYEALLAHYGMEPSRSNRGKPNENGFIEGGHGHLKSRLDQALLLRGSRDFESVDERRKFIDVVVARNNVRRKECRGHGTCRAPAAAKAKLLQLSTLSATLNFEIAGIYLPLQWLNRRRVTD